MVAPTRYRTVIEATSLIVGPALMSVGDLLHPAERWDPAAQVAIVSTSAAHWHMAHLLLLMGFLLFVPGILALTNLAAVRRPAIGYAARILMVASVGALSAVFACEMLLGHFISAGASQEAAVTLFATFQSAGVLGALMPGLLAFFIGVALLVVTFASRPGPLRWPVIALGLGAAFILGEIILAEVLLSQIGNILCFVAGLGFALALLRGRVEVSS